MTHRSIIEVGCAVIRHQGRVLIAQRKAEDRWGGYWEFPGGKKESWETLEACLVREAEEELGIRILPRQFLSRKDHLYPERVVALHFYLCDWQEGVPETRECQDFRWIAPEELRNFRFPPADDEIIEELILKRDLFFGG
jgi:8-oxo-dGTP diphosphatase